MTWEYRIIEKKIRFCSKCHKLIKGKNIYNVKRCRNCQSEKIKDVISLGVYEVFYNDKKEITAITQNSISPYGESEKTEKKALIELKSDLRYFEKALKKPILKEWEIKFAKDDFDLPRECDCLENGCNLFSCYCKEKK